MGLSRVVNRDRISSTVYGMVGALPTYNRVRKLVPRARVKHTSIVVTFVIATLAAHGKLRASAVFGLDGGLWNAPRALSFGDKVAAARAAKRKVAARKNRPEGKSSLAVARRNGHCWRKHCDRSCLPAFV